MGRDKTNIVKRPASNYRPGQDRDGCQAPVLADHGGQNYSNRPRTAVLGMEQRKKW